MFYEIVSKLESTKATEYFLEKNWEEITWSCKVRMKVDLMPQMNLCSYFDVVSGVNWMKRQVNL